MTIYKIKLLDENALDLLRSLDVLGVIQVLEKETVDDEVVIDAKSIESRVVARLEALEVAPPSEEEEEEIFAELKAERIAKHEAEHKAVKV
jgi:hypothetical protein